MCIWMQLYLHRKNKNCKLLIMLSNKCCEMRQFSSQSVINCKQSMWSWYHINKEDTTSCSCLLQLSWQMFLFPCTDSRGCHRLLILILKTGQHFVQFWLWLTRYIAAGQHRSKKNEDTVLFFGHKQQNYMMSWYFAVCFHGKCTCANSLSQVSKHSGETRPMISNQFLL